MTDTQYLPPYHPEGQQNLTEERLFENQSRFKKAPIKQDEALLNSESMKYIYQ